MKFKEKNISGHKKKKGEKKQRIKSTPLRIKVVDIDNTEKSDSVETKSAKKNGFVKKDRKKKELKPNINLMVTEEDDLASFQDDFELEDGDDDGDYQNFMEEMAKLDGKKRKITSSRQEGTDHWRRYMRWIDL